MQPSTEGSILRRSLIAAAVALLSCSFAYPQQKAAEPDKTPAPEKTSAPDKPPAPEKPPTQAKAMIPAGAERHFHAAVAFEKDGDVEAAIDEYKTAIKEDRKSTRLNSRHRCISD